MVFDKWLKAIYQKPFRGLGAKKMQKSNLYCYLFTGFLGFYFLPAYIPLSAQQKILEGSVNYRIAEVYMLGLDKLSEKHIQRYLDEYSIRENARKSKKQLEKAARHLANFAKSNNTLLSLELVYDYVDDNPEEPEVYIEVLVSEMSISFIPGGGNTYARFGWANRIQRQGLPSLIWLALGYNRQDIWLNLPYLGSSIVGFDVQLGHQIHEQWDFNKHSRIRSNFFVQPEIYIQPLSWLKLGLGLDAGLFYFLKGSPLDTLNVGERLGLGPKLNDKEGIVGKLQGRLALRGNLALDRDYLAKKGLGYHLLLQSQHELLGLFADHHSLALNLGLVTQPINWFRPSLEFRGKWRSEGMLPLKSEVFSSRYEGYIRGATELRLLFVPLHIKTPMAIELGWNLGAIVGFANISMNFSDINLERDFELSLFLGPEFYFGVPVNVRGQFDFGVIFRKQFQQIDFAFNFRIL